MLAVGIVAGAAGTQAMQLLTATRYLNTGLFTLGQSDTALFNVTLDDLPGQPSASVLMEIIDPAGITVARQVVSLAPGQSSTLKFAKPGSFRAHAEIVSRSSVWTDRRALITSLEIFGRSDDGGISIPRTYVCSGSDSGSGNGRLPD